MNLDDPSGLGKRIARRFIVREVHPSSRALAEQYGIEILEYELPVPAQPGLRSEYRHDPPRIILYRDPIASLSAAIHANQRFDMLKYDLDEIHIAHELFHHFEFGGRFGPLKTEAIEEAAHAFTQELLNLNFHPTEFCELVDDL